MKYACLYWTASSNVGDDIQSYAQRRFLPRIDYLIDRETMKLFHSDDGESVACILNAWYFHDEYTSWPPAPELLPLLISMHFTPSAAFLNRPEEGIELEYLRHYGPVGCRDWATQQRLEQRGVPSYFSGCLTLTLTPFEGVQPQKEILLVDTPSEVEEYLQKKGLTVRRESHTDATLSQYTFEERMDAVEARLKRYQAAPLVITTRLHCCLPCLALGTPVLLVYDGKESERYEGLRQMARTAPLADVLNGGWDAFFTAPTPNPEEFRPLAKKLREQCAHFIDSPAALRSESREFWQSQQTYAAYWRAVENYVKRSSELEQLVRGYYARVVASNTNERKAWELVKRYEASTQALQQIIGRLQEQLEAANKEKAQAWDFVKRYETSTRVLRQTLCQLQEQLEAANEEKAQAWGFVKQYEQDTKLLKNRISQLEK